MAFTWVSGTRALPINRTGWVPLRSTESTRPEASVFTETDCPGIARRDGDGVVALRSRDAGRCLAVPAERLRAGGEGLGLSCDDVARRVEDRDCPLRRAARRVDGPIGPAA